MSNERLNKNLALTFARIAEAARKAEISTHQLDHVFWYYKNIKGIEML